MCHPLESLIPVLAFHQTLKHSKTETEAFFSKKVASACFQFHFSFQLGIITSRYFDFLTDSFQIKDYVQTRKHPEEVTQDGKRNQLSQNQKYRLKQANSGPFHVQGFVAFAQRSMLA